MLCLYQLISFVFYKLEGPLLLCLVETEVKLLQLMDMLGCEQDSGGRHRSS
jgi:hypothetical protein